MNQMTQNRKFTFNVAASGLAPDCAQRPAFIYFNSAYISIRAETFHVQIACEEFETESLEDAEKWLWDNWLQPEIS